MELLGNAINNLRLLYKGWAKPPLFDEEDKKGRSPFPQIHKLAPPKKLQFDPDQHIYYQDPTIQYSYLPFPTPLKTGLEEFHPPFIEGGMAPELSKTTTIARFLKKKGRKADKLIVFISGWKSHSLNQIYRLAQPPLSRGYDFLFCELPYHLTRTPIGFRNGELFFTKDDEYNHIIIALAILEQATLLSNNLVKKYQHRHLIATDLGCSLGHLALQTLFRAQNSQIIERASFLSPWTELSNSSFLGRQLIKLTGNQSLQLLKDLDFTQLESYNIGTKEIDKKKSGLSFRETGGLGKLLT